MEGATSSNTQPPPIKKSYLVMQRAAIGTIIPNPTNPRIIKDDKFKKLVKSIQEFPQMLELRPIVVDGNMVVLGGNMRLKACIAAGLKEVPIIVADQLTDAQKSEFIIKDNVGFGEWDWDVLANEWDEQLLEDWGLELPLDYEEPKAIEAKEDEYEIPEIIESKIVVGDFIEIGNHRLLCGSSTEVDTWERLMGGELCDLVVTDPPYNIAYVGKTKDAMTIQNDNMSNADFYQFLLDFYTALASYTKAGGAWYVWHASTETANFSNAMRESGLLLKQYLVWVKNTIVLGRQDYQWKHELCLYGWKDGAAHYFTNERNHATVIEDKVDVNKLTKQDMKQMLNDMLSDKTKSTIIHCDKPSRSDVHPTMKPILLLAPLIQNSSREGELVCDAFLGSGSTMVAAHQLNRKCYGMELDPKYCQVIIDRMQKLDPNLEIKINGQIYGQN
jgi:site-specific DNA-methyltransferase (adenine-specific)